jgi:ketol-acid reductoisomerase
VYTRDIAPRLRSGQVLDFAHGYNIHFGLIRPPATVDVIMVAPRMIGINVRRSFAHGGGVPAYLAVAQDASGMARAIALAWAKGIGATRAGVLETTFAQETELDLFAEQGVWPIIMRDLLLSYEVLVEAGFPPEMVALELYGSGEAAEIFAQMARIGVIEQMRLHSQTSQYGTLSRGPRMLPDAVKELLREALREIRSGAFAAEWRAEQEGGYPRFEALRRAARAHDINAAEALGRDLLARTGLADGD